MFILLITLVLALLSIVISFRVTEEVECLGASMIALICLLLSLGIAPLWLKVLIFLFLLGNQTPVSLVSLPEKYR